MRDGLTDQEIERYGTNGFLAIHDLLDESELAYWREVVDAAIDGDLVRQPDGSNPMVFTQRMNLRRASPAVKSLVEDPGIARLVADLERIDAVRIYTDQALVKEPYSLPTSYHVDLPWWSFESDHACTIWVALDDATTENGCLYFVPGSHLLGLTYRSPSVGADLGGIFAVHPEAADRTPVSCAIPAGGCTFHNARTIHGAGVNMTSGRRRALTAAFMPDGVRFDGTLDLRSQGEYLETLSAGDLLQNDEHNPVVYARTLVVPSPVRSGVAWR